MFETFSKNTQYFSAPFQLSEQNLKKSWREIAGIFFIEPANNMAIKLCGDKTFNKSIVHQ